MRYPKEENVMRKLVLAVSAVSILMSVPLAATVKAEDTTVIKKDYPDGDSKTVIKKKDEPSEKKVIIKKDAD
jgi:hypothetical protein